MAKTPKAGWDAKAPCPNGFFMRPFTATIRDGKAHVEFTGPLTRVDKK